MEQFRLQNQRQLSTEKYIDRRTGREVITEPPDASFVWRAEHVLRASSDENKDFVSNKDRAIIGGDWFEWVPQSEVEIEKAT